MISLAELGVLGRAGVRLPGVLEPTDGDFDLIAKYLDFDALVLTNLNNSHIGIFGSEENILDRLYEASEKFNSEYIIRITGDNPLIDYALINLGMDYFLNFLQ